MGCLKLSFRETGERQNFLSVWRRGTPKKIDHRNFLLLGEKNAGKENCDNYYPFGLTFNSYSRESSVPNKYLYNGKEEQDELGLDWDSFKWRNHQPDIGRFFNIDPLAEKYLYNSPYAFSENKVTSHIELEGLEAIDANGIAAQDATKQQYARKPVEIKSQSKPTPQATLQIGPTDIHSGRVFLPHEQAMQTGVNIGQLATGVYALKNVPALLKDAKSLLGALKNFSTTEIKTPFGVAKQAGSEAALNAVNQVNEGASLYRVGTLGKSQAAEAQFWSLENPANIKDVEVFAQKFGIPAENLKSGEFFIEVGNLKSGAPFVTRPAPGVGTNNGGAIEVVTNPGSVKLSTFSTLKFE